SSGNKIFSGCVIIYDAEQAWMSQFAVRGPLNETDMDHDLGFHPVGTQTRQTFGFRERRLWNFDLVEPGAEIQKQFRVEAGSDLARENEVVVLVMTDEERAKTDSLSLRISETADEKILRQLTLHLQPLFREAMFVD